MMKLSKYLDLHNEALNIHIQEKTSYPLHHTHTEALYELAFDVYHQLSEKYQDIKKETPIDDDEAVQKAYDIAEKIKDWLGELIKGKTTPWEDNLLRALYDRAEFICGDLRGFVTEEKDEYDEKKSIMMPKK